jgi:hypothetical protein
MTKDHRTHELPFSARALVFLGKVITKSETNRVLDGIPAPSNANPDYSKVVRQTRSSLARLGKNPEHFDIAGLAKEIWVTTGKDFPLTEASFLDLAEKFRLAGDE